MMERWIIFSITAVILFGLGSFFGKLASMNDIPQRVYFFEAMGTLTVFTFFFIFKKSEILQNFSVNYFGLMMGITWGLGTVFFILALEKSKLSVLVPFTALYPAITVVLALLFLGEKLSIKEVIGILFATFAGILLVKK